MVKGIIDNFELKQEIHNKNIQEITDQIIYSYKNSPVEEVLLREHRIFNYLPPNFQRTYTNHLKVEGYTSNRILTETNADPDRDYFPRNRPALELEKIRDLHKRSFVKPSTPIETYCDSFLD